MGGLSCAEGDIPAHGIPWGKGEGQKRGEEREGIGGKGKQEWKKEQLRLRQPSSGWPNLM